MRGIALGRKNYLFLGSDAGGERAATLYSLLETAKLNGMNPEAYLREVLTVIADYPVNRVEEFLPWRLQTDAGIQRLCCRDGDYRALAKDMYLTNYN